MDRPPCRPRTPGTCLQGCASPQALGSASPSGQYLDAKYATYPAQATYKGARLGGYRKFLFFFVFLALGAQPSPKKTSCKVALAALAILGELGSLQCDRSSRLAALPPLGQSGNWGDVLAQLRWGLWSPRSRLGLQMYLARKDCLSDEGPTPASSLVAYLRRRLEIVPKGRSACLKAKYCACGVDDQLR